jgi:hypothetical protein
MIAGRISLPGYANWISSGRDVACGLLEDNSSWITLGRDELCLYKNQFVERQVIKLWIFSLV